MVRLILMFCCALLLSGSGALAWGFGKSEDLHFIADVPAVGPDGSDLVLSDKTTTMWVFAPIYMSDDGYVLQPRGDSEKYYSLKPELVTALQATGELPNPLPPYQISWLDYYMGYALWTLVIPLALIYGLLSTWRARRKAAQEPGSP
jgi:hypothetical protein